MSFIKEDEEIEAKIEGLLFKIKGVWVAGFATPESKIVRSKVDYNPWTGERLK